MARGTLQIVSRRESATIPQGIVPDKRGDLLEIMRDQTGANRFGWPHLRSPALHVPSDQQTASARAACGQSGYWITTQVALDGRSTRLANLLAR